MAKIFYNIIPPEGYNGKISRKPSSRIHFGEINKKSRGFRFGFGILENSLVKIVALLVIVALNFGSLLTVHRTVSYLNNTESSNQNNFISGILDFELNSTQIFSDLDLNGGEQATGTIELVNLDNIPKYKVKADNFSGLLCDYLNLEANLDGDGVEYSGPLKSFDYGPVVFEAPDNWFFSLTLSGNATDTLVGETCIFDFVFYGSQVRNNLPFGQGFTDEENDNNNVKAKLCYDAQTRSCEYWKNHTNVFKPYLPQMLGNELIDTVQKASNVLKTACGTCGCGCDNSTRGKLKGQLLTMKFNVAHYGVEDYFVTSTSQTINEIIAQADALLAQDPVPPDEELEEMKNLLESLVDLSIRACKESYIKVLVPNCGEVWWVGRTYDITWSSKNLVCEAGSDPQISIWYSGDSGNTWGKIIQNTENDGVYTWRVPLYLSDGYYTPSDRARVKLIASCPEGLQVINWDMSDCDFCPPIDFSLLTPEELEQAKSLGLIMDEEIKALSEESNNIERTTAEATTTDLTTESTTTKATTTEELPLEEGGGSIIENPIFSNVDNATKNNTTTDTGLTSTTTEDVITPDTGSIETEQTTTEETSTTAGQGATSSSTTEIAPAEQSSAIEVQPVTGPENSSTDIIPTDTDNSNEGTTSPGDAINP